MPVPPETSTSESRCSPPPHIASSSGLPSVSRSDGACLLSSTADRGMMFTPVRGSIVNGYSPLWCGQPLSLRISIVRRRFSPWSGLRSTITLSATKSSTSKRATGPYSSLRSSVSSVVTPISRNAAITRRSSRRTIVGSVMSGSSAPSASTATRLALTFRTALSIRAISPSKSKSPIVMTSSVAACEPSTTASRPSRPSAWRSQPNPATFAAMSWGVSSNVASTPGCPNCLTPSMRNCTAKTVLPLPAVPTTTVVRRSDRPPMDRSSKPAIPTGTRVSPAPGVGVVVMPACPRRRSSARCRARGSSRRARRHSGHR